ncbi:NADH-cytochrome b5 reductase 1 [Pseudocercospora fuligena]|uniref:NADH-cytochrome b5 reductase 1 n=1 Tax=Pseudocercospora fuligena TaxID=685502 RepID=A0A8H6RMV7_9PEZI|nr:NADH-cytochrome b5 reductase 1 [Pseudocercospora fuligena]
MTSSERVESKSQWKTEVEVPHLEKQDVAKHNTKSDLWIIIHGKVRARDHPGGADAIFEVAGQDATSAYEDVGHSEDAGEIMHQFLVGVIEGSSSTKSPAKPAVQVVRRGPTKTDAKSGYSLQLEVAVVAVGTAAMFWWLASNTRLTHSLLPKGGFGSGFALASIVCGVGAVVGYSRLDQAMAFKGSYPNYPAHMHASHAVASINHPAGFLKPQEYQKLPLERRDELSRDTVRLVFRLPQKTSVLGLPIGQHVAVRGYFDDEKGHHTVVRSYTPVSNNKDLGRLELVIKMYPDGQLTGKYLSSLQIGDQVEFRGPKGAMRYRKGLAKKIGMIVGGTGVTPMYQLIRAICEDKTDETQVQLICANRTPSDILLQTQLDRYQKMAPGKFDVLYIVDQSEPGWKGKVGRVDKAMMQEYLPGAEKDNKIMLCGPPGMVNAMIKNLVGLGFEKPGAVSKITDQVFVF